MKPIKPETHRGPACTRWAGVLLFLVTLSGPIEAQTAWPPAPPLESAPETDPGPLPVSVRAEPLEPGRWRCTFSFRPPAGAQEVTLAGTFNGWNRATDPLRDEDGDGVWSVTRALPAGVHAYKFVVDGRQWLRDPLNPEGADDGHGGQNSVLRLGRRAALKVSNARVGDGKIDPAGFEHNPRQPLYFQALSRSRVLLRFQTLAHDVARVWVSLRDGDLTEMQPVRQDALATLYEAEVTLPESTHRGKVHRLDYVFILEDGPGRWSTPNTYSRSFTDEDVFQTPEWARHAVWYQIMVDRFRNGNPANDPQPVNTWTRDWFNPEPWEEASGQSFYQYYVFKRQYGGDIDGLEQKLPYLRSLGVNALYLNPVFKADSHHKYDTISYIHIDDHFGVRGDYDRIAPTEDLLDPGTWKWTPTDRRFLRFIEKAHRMGFHVIIDGVFNHVGRGHPAFQDVLKNGRNSRFADWFNVTSWEPFRYTGWGGFGELPEFRKNAAGLASPTAKEHLFNITRRWMDPNGDGDPSDGVDGWRLDVPNEIPAPFWAEWRRLVKSINADAYITGEIWDRADAWLDGRHFDAVMNYPFARAVVAWVMDREWKIPVSEFDRRLETLRFAYPLPATLVLQNLLDSHDTDRLVSMAINPDRAYDHANRIQDNGPNYDNAKPPPWAYRKARLAALIQMTYVGAPMIYYGDEVGMWGADDPNCRKPMLWKDLEPYEKPEENHVMRDHLAFYRRAIKLRREHPALRTGSFTTLLTDDQADVWAFLRRNVVEQLLVVLNGSDQPRTVTVPLPDEAPTYWRGVFGTEAALRAEDGRLTVEVPALGGVVFFAHSPRR